MMLIHTLAVFAKLNTEPIFKKQFYSIKNQKEFIIKIVKESLEQDSIGVNTQDECEVGHSLKAIYDKCFSIITNVVLNNYCKLENNKLSEKEKAIRKKDIYLNKLMQFYKFLRFTRLLIL